MRTILRKTLSIISKHKLLTMFIVGLVFFIGLKIFLDRQDIIRKAFGIYYLQEFLAPTGYPSLDSWLKERGVQNAYAWGWARGVGGNDQAMGVYIEERYAHELEYIPDVDYPSYVRCLNTRELPFCHINPHGYAISYYASPEGKAASQYYESEYVNLYYAGPAGALDNWRNFIDFIRNQAQIIPLLLSGIPFLYWFYFGLVGGWILTKKRLQGTNGFLLLLVVFLFGSIPLILWLLFMVVIGFTGKWGKKLAIKAKPAKRQCSECRGWSDYKATRCMHCAQPLIDTVGN